ASASFDGQPVPGSTLEARVEALRSRTAALSSGDVFVAAAPDVDVRTLRAYLSALPAPVAIHLLVRARGEPEVTDERAANEGAAAPLAARLLAESNPEARAALARDGYGQFARCDAFARAVASVEGKPQDRR